MKKQPERTCIVCKAKGSKEMFFKIVKNKNGEIDIEKETRLDGRGAYICKKQECLDKCKKTKALARVFKTNVPMSVYEELNNEN